ncbi:hypothetical protein KM043_005489 [Ampulex compressa]|nr:hypothetical protein KM043_005489 [Ampulex compressa]
MKSLSLSPYNAHFSSSPSLGPPAQRRAPGRRRKINPISRPILIRRGGSLTLHPFTAMAFLEEGHANARAWLEEDEGASSLEIPAARGIIQQRLNDGGQGHALKIVGLKGGPQVKAE